MGCVNPALTMILPLKEKYSYVGSACFYLMCFHLPSAHIVIPLKANFFSSNNFCAGVIQLVSGATNRLGKACTRTSTFISFWPGYWWHFKEKIVDGMHEMCTVVWDLQRAKTHSILYFNFTIFHNF